MTEKTETDLIIEQIEIGPMKNFTYLVGSRATREVMVVDPAWDIGFLVDHIADKGYRLTGALVTHYHPDHVGGSFANVEIEGLAELMARSPVRCYVNRLELDGVKQVTGLSDSDLKSVDSGDRISIGDIEVEFLHTPGHTPGSQCFRIHDTLVSGDTLFIDGCGRVDLPGSDPDQMYHSLQKLSALPDHTVLLPGHNYSHVPKATMAETRACNRYLKIGDLATWRRAFGH